MPDQFDALAKRFGGIEEPAIKPANPADFTDHQQPEGSAAGRFLSNAGEVLNPITMLQGLYGAVRHPIDTVSNVVTAQVNQGKQAIERAKEGRYSEAAGHGVASLIPLLGPAAAEAGEQIGSGDVAGGLGRGTGLLIPAAAPGAARAAARTLPNRAAGALEAGAAERVADVMSPKVGANKTRFGNNAEKVAPQIAKDLAADGAPMTREGLHGNVQVRLKQAEQGLDAAADARLAARTFETKPLIDDLLKKRQELTARAVDASALPRPAGPPTTRTTMGVPAKAETGPNAPIGASIETQAVRGSVPTTTTTMGIPGRGHVITRMMFDNDAPPTTTQRAPTQPVRGQMTGGGPVPREGAPPTTSQVSVAGRPLGKDVVPGPNAARVAQIDQAIKELQHLGPVARYESIRRIRAAYDQPAKAKYSPSMTADYLKAQGGASGAADVTGVLREHLAKWDPQTAAANADYHLYRTADDVLEATREVERTRPRLGRAIMARLTGTIFGGQAAGTPGAIAGYVGGPVVDSLLASGATTKLKTAAMMQRLAQAIRGGNEAEAGAYLDAIKRLTAQGTTLTATSPTAPQRQPAPASAGQ